MDYAFYVLFAYLALVAVFIISENRRPQAAFAWMFLFASVPALGILIYLLFGRDRKAFSRETKLLSHESADHRPTTFAEVRGQHDAAMKRHARDNPLMARLATLVHSNAQTFVTTENRLEVLENAREFYPRLFDDLRAARKSIHLQFFIWAADEVGRELQDILLERAAAGVEVRVLYDPVGSFRSLSWRYLRAMRKGGVQMIAFSPIWRLHTIGYRNHRKIAVIDGTIGYTGGLNISQEHIEPGLGFAIWRDTHIRIVGAGVLTLQATFAVDWINAAGEDLREPEYFPPVPEIASDADLPVQMTLSGPDSHWNAIRQLYFAMITGARQRVWLQSPFFVLEETIAEALKAAALAGIDVRVMISARGMRQRLPFWAGNTYAQEVARAGVKIYLYEHGYLHAKTVAVDGEVCSIGSANMDIRSFNINYELNAVIYDAGVTRRIEAAFEHDLAGCYRFDPDAYKERPRLLRFRDSLARLCAPLL